MAQNRICPLCSGPKDWAALRCRSCQRATPPKPCEFCGKMMERKVMNGRREDRAMFARRRHCSRICGNSRVVVTRHGASQRAYKLRHPNCEVCGATESLREGTPIKLDVHHADGNRWNNSPENLQTLCHNCHMKWHHAHGLRGVKAVGRMPTDWLDGIVVEKKPSRGRRPLASLPDQPPPPSSSASETP